jgi:hypothetical protein
LLSFNINQMLQAYTLLMLASTLLTSVFSSPNIPQDLRDKAISNANYAITYAQNVIAQGEPQSTGSPTVAPVQTFGSVVQPLPTCTLTASSSPIHGQSLSWTSTGATQATAYESNGYDGGVPVWKYPTELTPVDSGYRAGFGLDYKNFKVQFTGQGGSVTCLASI